MKKLIQDKLLNGNTALIALMIFAALCSSCSTTSPIGRASKALANALHNPVYEEKIVGMKIVEEVMVKSVTFN